MPVWEKYDRVVFDKELLSKPGTPMGDFICPGHPLLDTVNDLIRRNYAELLRMGTILVDPTDPGQSPRLLFFLEQNIQDARTAQRTDQRVISREVHFVEINERGGEISLGGSAPYLDYDPITDQELEKIQDTLTKEWLAGEGLESQVVAYAIERLVPRHLERVQKQREELIDKTLAAVYERLTKEVNYWDRRAAELRAEEKAGHFNARLNSTRAQQRAEELADRLERRTRELALERQISATPPVIIGGALVIPIGMLRPPSELTEIIDTRVTEQIAMQAVMQQEAALGNHPRDVSAEDRGYDIESFDPRTGLLRFIEVKGRRAGAETVTVTRNEILTGFNSPEQFILALVEVENNQAGRCAYVRKPFAKEPDFGVTSVNYNLNQLLERPGTQVFPG